jgi:flavin reductase (DIM6/NTAB) family NADH-FMN oxidoreductase RutF
MYAHCDDFKRSAAMFASGVTVITSRMQDRVHGITASAFSSVSLDPPRVLVCVSRNSKLHDMVLSSGCFGVSILADDQEQLGSYFASPGRDPVASFVEIDVPHIVQHTGTPILRGSAAFFDCTLAEAYDGGDHSILLGAVQASGADELKRPLLYFQRGYRRLVLP